jgi:drug/metabolite transporter (DMT)-like permease
MRHAMKRIAFSLRSQQAQAIWFMVASMFFLSAMNTALQMLGNNLHSTQIVVFRQLWSIIIVVVWAAWLARGKPDFSTKRLRGHFWRATFGISAMELWFHSITIMPMTLATAISFTTPIFSTICAIIFLGEKAGIRRWSAILAGFAGMLIILRPDVGGIDANAWFVIGASMLMAVSGIMVKSLTDSEPPETIVFYMALFMLPWSVAPSIPFWKAFTGHDLWMAFIIAFCSTVAHLFMARAFKRAELVVLIPFDFTRLIFTAGLAYVFFGETIDSATALGALVIVASTVYIAHREALHKRKQASTALAVDN